MLYRSGTAVEIMHDYGGRESVTEKMRLYPFKQYHVCLATFILSNVSEIYWSWILKARILVLNRKGKKIQNCSRPPSHQEVWRRGLSVVDVKKIYH